MAGRGPGLHRRAEGGKQLNSQCVSFQEEVGRIGQKLLHPLRLVLVRTLDALAHQELLWVRAWQIICHTTPDTEKKQATRHRVESERHVSTSGTGTEASHQARSVATALTLPYAEA